MASEIDSTHRVAVLRLALTGAIASALVLILCWLGTFIPFSSPTHAYIGLFTPVEMSSVAALIQGTIWSFLFGGVAGAVVAAVYNALAALERK